MSNKALIESLLPVNCAYNYSEESISPTETTCRSTTCMLNADIEVAKEIQLKGCNIFKIPEVQDIIKRKKTTT